jgi:hypothetical protein
MPGTPYQLGLLQIRYYVPTIPKVNNTDLGAIGVLLGRNLAQGRGTTGHSDGNNKTPLLQIVTLRGRESF